ncbi:pantothenate transporter-like protein [Bipolaris maydis]|nr:pantothenate transporter-like protein [Bipolaris maydis]
MFTAGSCTGQIPHALIIQKVAPRFWLPFTLIVWSGLTMCSAACKTYAKLCVVRFLQGFFEASLYSGTIYILGSWYKAIGDCQKNCPIFTAIGTDRHLHGQSSLAGWQWFFIINGAMGIPFGIFGLLFFPNLPESPNTPYLRQRGNTTRIGPSAAQKRLGPRYQPQSLAKRLLGKPDIYILSLYSMIGCALEAIRNCDDASRSGHTLHHEYGAIHTMHRIGRRATSP